MIHVCVYCKYVEKISLRRGVKTFPFVDIFSLFIHFVIIHTHYKISECIFFLTKELNCLNKKRLRTIKKLIF